MATVRWKLCDKIYVWRRKKNNDDDNDHDDGCKIDTKLHSEFRRNVVCRRLGISLAMVCSPLYRQQRRRRYIYILHSFATVVCESIFPVLCHVKRSFFLYISLFGLFLSRLKYLSYSEQGYIYIYIWLMLFVILRTNKLDKEDRY